MHLGMTGWIKFSNDDSAYYKPKKEEDTEWPPKYWKFIFQTENENKEKCEVAFIDARRLARIRLVEAEGDQLRNTSPLKENGPDPVIDKDILTVEWLSDKMRSKRVPVKALLLDQANISGVGNWVADEVLYQARIHPEQYSNTFSDAQMKALHDSLTKVCGIAVETLSDSSKFPDDWIMRYRWDKGKKDSNVLPNGEKITHIKVGGRTSAIVLSRQKKTGAVAGDVSDGEAEKLEEGEGKAKMKTKTATGRGTKRKSNGEDAVAPENPTPAKKGRKSRKPGESEEESADLNVQKSTPAKKERKGKKPSGPEDEQSDSKAEVAQNEADAGVKEEVSGKGKKTAKNKQPPAKPEKETPGRRRSARIKSE